MAKRLGEQPATMKTRRRGRAVTRPFAPTCGSLPGATRPHGPGYARALIWALGATRLREWARTSW